MLSLRNYRHDLIAHTHDHPQLVFGLDGLLEFEIAGRGSYVGEQRLAVIPSAVHHACSSTKVQSLPGAGRSIRALGE